MTTHILKAIALASFAATAASAVPQYQTSAPTGAATTAAVSVPLDHTGDYIVPAPAELASVSAFKIQYGIGQTDDGRKVLSYQLPDYIAGAKQPVIVLTQTGPENNGFVPFGNRFDSANCRVQTDDITCFVLYPGMDTTGSEEAVKAHFGNQPDFAQRLQLAQLFSADPKGVLHIKPF